MKIHFEGDAESLKKAGEKLKANPNAVDDLASDPHGFLRTLGLEVDDETAKALQSRAQRSRTSSAQSAAIHVDI
jgi:hypothetical protein